MSNAAARTRPHAAFWASTLRTRKACKPAQTANATSRERSAASTNSAIISSPPFSVCRRCELERRHLFGLRRYGLRAAATRRGRAPWSRPCPQAMLQLSPRRTSRRCVWRRGRPRAGAIVRDGRGRCGLRGCGRGSLFLQGGAERCGRWSPSAADRALRGPDSAVTLPMRQTMERMLRSSSPSSAGSCPDVSVTRHSVTDCNTGKSERAREIFEEIIFGVGEKDRPERLLRPGSIGWRHARFTRG